MHVLQRHANDPTQVIHHGQHLGAGGAPNGAGLLPPYSLDSGAQGRLIHSSIVA